MEKGLLDRDPSTGTLPVSQLDDQDSEQPEPEFILVWNLDRLYKIRVFGTYRYVPVCTGMYRYVPVCTQYRASDILVHTVENGTSYQYVS